jgi:uncharacterized protein YodC (DUF2158 family)
MAFASGDVVQLKSGGPKMTVKHIGTMLDDEEVVCVWFEEVGKKQVHTEKSFNPNTLKKVE